MLLFETAWRDGFQWYERVYNDVTKQTEVLKIDSKSEYFTTDPNGTWHDFLNPNITYSPCLGKAADARINAGSCMPVYRHLRDVRTKFNHDARVWYLDIETRADVIRVINPAYLNETFYVNEGEKYKGYELATMHDDIYRISRDGINYTRLSAFASTYDLFLVAEAFPKPALAQHTITAIQINDSTQNQIIILCLREFDQARLSHYKDLSKVKFCVCRDELTLIKAFIKIFKHFNPVMVLAWNGDSFDFPYLYHRFKHYGLEQGLSNYGPVSIEKIKHTKDKYRLTTPGHEFIDFMEVYKKFTFTPQTSYALDNIADFELGVGKVEHDEFNSFDSLYTGRLYSITKQPINDKLREDIRQAKIANSQDFYDLVYLLFIKYAIVDVELLARLDTKLRLSMLMLVIGEKMGVLLSDTLRTVKPWAQYISNQVYSRHMVVPYQGEPDESEIIGGYVKDPNPGRYRWVLNADVNSMYPRLSITAFNMSPETFISPEKAPPGIKEVINLIVSGQDENRLLNIPDSLKDVLTQALKKHHLCMGVNGALFDASKVGLVPELVTNIYNERKVAKFKMLQTQAKLALINDLLEDK